MPPDLPARIILFDSACNLCNGWAGFILKHDRNARFTLCRVQSPAGQRLLCELGRPLDTYATLLYLENPGVNSGQVYEKSAAVLRIMAQLPMPWRAAKWCQRVPEPLRDWVYDRVAGNRYRLFGRRQKCRLPGAAERQRFLEDLDEHHVN
ncbi:hypothetical protein Maes01_02178 [Microbulbifer aestuariivivens]|uniref:Thiol-disulfide oxidoreductase DCC family protein n=1 Tax=Microbulbifer aestuariivivens TaxID=1908308 RepID=A0ABP9WQX3_9GAMM